MTDRNWDAELAKIDRQLASLSDDALLRGSPRAGPAPAGSAPAAPPPVAPAAPRRAGTGTAPVARWQGWVRTGVAVGAAVGVWYWPWPGTCGAPVVGLVSAAVATAGLGVWSAVGTWRQRHAALHVVSLLAALWGGVMAAREVLPRVGYAIPSTAHPAAWRCELAAPASPSAPSAPSPSAPAAPSPSATPTGGTSAVGAPTPPLALVPSLLLSA
ncbi:MAG: hypothetical protein KJT01_01950 [Gemmatimonadetes bacterium]|nr:hypothetical protein [Gemmatimonadota bacterium]